MIKVNKDKTNKNKEKQKYIKINKNEMLDHGARALHHAGAGAPVVSEGLGSGARRAYDQFQNAPSVKIRRPPHARHS